MEFLYRFLEIITSGRISSNSLQPEMFREIVEKSPLIGLGYGTVTTTDMGFLEIFVMSGILGLLIYLFIFVYIFLRLLNTSSSYKKEKLFLFFIWIILLFSTLGGSAITANRVSIFIWVITTLILLKISKKKYYLRMFRKYEKKSN